MKNMLCLGPNNIKIAKRFFATQKSVYCCCDIMAFCRLQVVLIPDNQNQTPGCDPGLRLVLIQVWQKLHHVTDFKMMKNICVPFQILKTSL